MAAAIVTVVTRIHPHNHHDMGRVMRICLQIKEESRSSRNNPVVSMDQYFSGSSYRQAS